jgi:hypothetical protein
LGDFCLTAQPSLAHCPAAVAKKSAKKNKKTLIGALEVHWQRGADVNK